VSLLFSLSFFLSLSLFALATERARDFRMAIDAGAEREMWE
jgi:hypothetical protein